MRSSNEHTQITLLNILDPFLNMHNPTKHTQGATHESMQLKRMQLHATDKCFEPMWRVPIGLLWEGPRLRRGRLERVNWYTRRDAGHHARCHARCNAFRVSCSVPSREPETARSHTAAQWQELVKLETATGGQGSSLFQSHALLKGSFCVIRETSKMRPGRRQCSNNAARQPAVICAPCQCRHITV